MPDDEPIMTATEEPKIKALAPWFGGKRTLAPRIVAELGPHRAYWEPFAGGISIIFAKPVTPFETINDLFGEIVNLARVVAHDELAVKLYDRMTRTLMHEVLHREAAELAKQAATVAWHQVPTGNLARQLRSDLAAAGIAYETPEGVFDFHALRHQCGALLASAQVPVKAIQKHMRHASIRMTLDTYGHLLDADRHATNAALDDICKRVAQRAGVGSEMIGTTNRNALAEERKGQWSDGESNPDLLNAIQKSDAVLTLIDNTLRSRRGKAVAPRAAQRLLARAFARASRRTS